MRFSTPLFFVCIICYIGPTLSQTGLDDDEGDFKDRDELKPEPISSVLYSKKYRSVCHIKEKWGKARKLVNYYNKEYLNRFDKKNVEKSKQCPKNKELDSLTKELVKNVCDPKADQEKIAKEISKGVCKLSGDFAEGWELGYIFPATVSKPVFLCSPAKQFNKIEDEEPISAVLYSDEYKSVCHIQEKWDKAKELSDYYNKEFLNQFEKNNHEKSKKCLRNGKLDSLTKELVKNVCDKKADQSKMAERIVGNICNLAAIYADAWDGGYMFSANVAKPDFLYT